MVMILSSMTGIVVLYAWHYTIPLETSFLFSFTVVYFILLLIHANLKYRNLYSVEIILLVLIFIHHLFFPIGAPLGFVRYSSQIVSSSQALYVIMLFMTSMLFGCSMKLNKGNSLQNDFEPFNLETYIKIGLFIWCSAIAFEITLHILTGGQEFIVRSLTKARGEVTWPERFISFNHFVSHIGLLIVIISSLYRYNKVFPKPIFWLILLFNFAIITFTGDRQEAFSLTLVIICLKSKITKPINPLTVSLVGLVSIFLIVAISEGRAKQQQGIPVYQGILEELHLREPQKENSVKKIPIKPGEERTLIAKFWSKTGAAFFNVERTITKLRRKEYKPEEGRSYLLSLFSAIPFRSRIFDYMSYSEWCAMVGDPYDWKLRGHGTGGSIIGEAYWNFEMWGIIPIGVLFGILAASLEKYISRDYGIIVKVWAATIFYAFIYMLRNDFGGFFKSICWHGFIIGITFIVIKNQISPKYSKTIKKSNIFLLKS